jgi:hypothetical protein
VNDRPVIKPARFSKLPRNLRAARYSSVKYLTTCFAAFALAACAPTGTTSAPSPSPIEQGDAVDHVLSGTLAMDPISSPTGTSGITVPILRAPALEAKYGKPKYHVMSDGSYQARYDWGQMYLKIVGTQRPPVPKDYDTDSSFDLLGKTQGAYGTGNEDPEFTSKAARLTAPDGRSANYIIIYGGNRDHITQQGLLKSVPKFSW